MVSDLTNLDLHSECTAGPKSGLGHIDRAARTPLHGHIQTGYAQGLALSLVDGRCKFAGFTGSQRCLRLHLQGSAECAGLDSRS